MSQTHQTTGKMANLKRHAKSFQHPKTGRFQEADRSACEYLSEKRNEEMPLTGADIQLKALEITKELNIPTTEFKVCVTD